MINQKKASEHENGTDKTTTHEEDDIDEGIDHGEEEEEEEEELFEQEATPTTRIEIQQVSYCF